MFRYTPRRKRAIIEAIHSGALSHEEALKRHQLSAEELAAWERDFTARGLAGLAVTKVELFRARK